MLRICASERRATCVKSQGSLQQQLQVQDEKESAIEIKHSFINFVGLQNKTGC